MHALKKKINVSGFNKPLRKYNIISSKLSTILKRVSLSSATSETNEFPRFKEEFLIYIFFFLSVLKQRKNPKGFRNVSAVY